jgi:mutator protein MutT
MHPKEFHQNCPRCGSSHFAADSANSLSCSDCEFCWYYNAAAAADVILCNALGEILVTRRAGPPAQGQLDFPGGFVNEGESAELALCRELREETGIVLVPEQLHYMASFPNQYLFGGLTYFALDLVFTAEVEDIQASAIGDDVASAHFLVPSAIDPNEFGLESTRQAFRHYQDKRRA